MRNGEKLDATCIPTLKVRVAVAATCTVLIALKAVAASPWALLASFNRKLRPGVAEEDPIPSLSTLTRSLCRTAETHTAVSHR